MGKGASVAEKTPDGGSQWLWLMLALLGLAVVIGGWYQFFTG
jgi:MYXO-CTERM domain-containing protein